MTTGSTTLATTKFVTDQLAGTPTTEQCLVLAGKLWQGSTTGITLTTPGHSFYPEIIAPFPMKLVQVSLHHASGADIVGDNTNFYGFAIQRMRAKTGAAVVSRATTVGNSFPVNTDWNFDLGTFDPTNQQFSKGDILQVVVTATGTPAVVLGDFGITARFEPQ